MRSGNNDLTGIITGDKERLQLSGMQDFRGANASHVRDFNVITARGLYT